MHKTLIKHVATSKYQVSMVEHPLGYSVNYSIPKLHLEYEGDIILDYGTASFIFDIKLNELEGH